MEKQLSTITLRNLIINRKRMIGIEYPYNPKLNAILETIEKKYLNYAKSTASNCG